MKKERKKKYPFKVLRKIIEIKGRVGNTADIYRRLKEKGEESGLKK